MAICCNTSYGARLRSITCYSIRRPSAYGALIAAADAGSSRVPLDRFERQSDIAKAVVEDAQQICEYAQRTGALARSPRATGAARADRTGGIPVARRRRAEIDVREQLGEISH